MIGDEKCPKCGKPSYYSCLGGLCGDCKRNGKTMITIVCIFLAFIFMIVGAVLGIVHYNYDLEKCSNLKSTISSYDFDNKIELDANYNEHCYFLKNHPLAIFANILLGIMFGIAIPIILGMVWSFKYI